MKPHESKPWNPILARVFYLYGVIEACGPMSEGCGTLKIFEETKNLGLREPKIEERSGSVVVTFFAPKNHIPENVNLSKLALLSDRQMEILDFLKLNSNGVSKKDLIQNLKCSEKDLELDLLVLKGLNRIDRFKKGRLVFWKALI